MGTFARAGFQPEWGIDKYFLTKAKKDKKKMQYLEKAQDQIDIFIKLSEKAELEMIMDTVQNIDKMADILDKSWKAWLKADEKELQKLMLDDAEKQQEFFKKIFTDRNIKMADKIDTYLKGEGVYFVMAGSGHFIGKGSVNSLLKDKGYKIEKK